MMEEFPCDPDKNDYGGRESDHGYKEGQGSGNNRLGKFKGSNHDISQTARRSGGHAPQQGGARLDGAGKEGKRPFHERRYVAHDGGGGDCSRGDSKGRGYGVEKIIHPRNVIGPDLQRRRRGKSDQGRPRPDPLTPGPG